MFYIIVALIIFCVGVKYVNEKVANMDAAIGYMFCVMAVVLGLFIAAFHLR